MSDMNTFEIRTYGRTELAQLYCPNLCPESAYRKLKHWIELYPGLCDDLAAVGRLVHLVQRFTVSVCFAHTCVFMVRAFDKFRFHPHSPPDRASASA